ncbi:MAG: diguanylate cyclase, partial [Lachnospiraceae bacterium]|nr:diguanylate cyclase [Lachnospiraceae bacterium]
MYKISDEIRRIYEALEVPLFMMTVDNGEVTSVLFSDGFLKLQGVSRENLVSVYAGNIEGSLFERVHPEETAKLKRVTDDFLFGFENEYDVIFRAKFGDEYRFIHAVGFHQRFSSECKASIIVYSDMKKHEEVVTRITERYRFFGNDDFYMDKLTDLPNINYFHQFGMEKTKDIVAMRKTPVIMYYDVDSMQSYNNQYGVKAGDDLL